MHILIFFILAILASLSSAHAVELVIGDKRVEPGIRIIFEAAAKDNIIPHNLHLPENQTDIHIEARVNWDERDIPKGAIAGGFVPYLKITATVIRQKGNKCSGRRSFIDLTPHINLIDNFHYARNMTLPGAISASYCVIFMILPPSEQNLALHRDWVMLYKKQLFKPQRFLFKKINFEKIARARRK